MDRAVVSHLIYGSFFLDRPRWQIVSVPKAACTAVKWWLWEWQAPHRLNRPFISAETTPDLVIHDRIRADLPMYQVASERELMQRLGQEDCFRFAFVRNPYSRIFSSWSSKVVLTEPSQTNDLAGLERFLPAPGHPESIAPAFERFLEYLASVQDDVRWRNSHWRPQTHLLLWPRVKFHIYRVEAMASAWQHLQSLVPDTVLPPFRRVNESFLPYSASFLSGRSRTLIKTLYANDFAAFAYDPDTVPSGRDLPDEAVAQALAIIEPVRARNRRIWEIANDARLLMLRNRGVQ